MVWFATFCSIITETICVSDIYVATKSSLVSKDPATFFRSTFNIE